MQLSQHVYLLLMVVLLSCIIWRGFFFLTNGHVVQMYVDFVTLRHGKATVVF